MSKPFMFHAGPDSIELDKDEIREYILEDSDTPAELISKAENAKLHFTEIGIIEMIEEKFQSDLADRLYEAEKDRIFLQNLITEYCDKLQAVINKPLNA